MHRLAHHRLLYRHVHKVTSESLSHLQYIFVVIHHPEHHHQNTCNCPRCTMSGQLQQPCPPTIATLWNTSLLTFFPTQPTPSCLDRTPFHICTGNIVYILYSISRTLPRHHIWIRPLFIFLLVLFICTMQCNLKGLVHLVSKGGLSRIQQARPTTVGTGQLVRP